MNRSTVLHVLGLLLLFLAAAMLFPIPFSALLCGRHSVGVLGGGCDHGCGRLPATPLYRSPAAICASRTGSPSSPLAGWPHVCSARCRFCSRVRIPNPTDALFETISGFTTTGATILNDIEVLPPAILLYRDLHALAGRHGHHRAVRRYPALPGHRRHAALSCRGARPHRRPADAAHHADGQDPVGRLCVDLGDGSRCCCCWAA